jgi:hypothetical protein
LANLPPDDHACSVGTAGEVGADHGPTSNRLACDVCGHARTREERNRLVWESGFAGELILADLCSSCATKAAGPYGLPTVRAGTLRLVQHVAPSAPDHRVVGFIAHGVLYLLIAVTFFVIVTLISSSAH